MNDKPPALAAFRNRARILFQGDSITDGNRGRNADPNHILGHGYAFLIAARYGAAFPERELEFFNRGISGNTVLNLETRWQPDTLELRPDLLSVLIGINDYSRAVPPDTYEQTYDRLLTQARDANPALRLVLAEPFGLPVGQRKENGDAWRMGLHAYQQIAARLASKHGAALVPLQKAFEDATKRAPAEHWIWDGIHPTYSGHQILADAWIDTVHTMKASKS